MAGFVAIHRRAFDHPLLRDGDRFRAWCWLIATACWKPIPFDNRGRTITLNRGQLCVSRQQLAVAWGWSGSAVERFLARLETEQMIERETGQGRTIITLCNYARYQDLAIGAGQETEQLAGQKSDRNRTAKEQGNKGTNPSEVKTSSGSRARTRNEKPHETGSALFRAALRTDDLTVGLNRKPSGQ